MMKFHYRLTAFLRSIHLINLDQHSPAIPTLRRQENNFNCPPFFFLTSIQFVACTMRGNLSNRSSGVQIPRDICTRFGRYFYFSKHIWLITHFINNKYIMWTCFVLLEAYLKKIGIIIEQRHNFKHDLEKIWEMLVVIYATFKGKIYWGLPRGRTRKHPSCVLQFSQLASDTMKVFVSHSVQVAVVFLWCYKRKFKLYCWWSC